MNFPAQLYIENTEVIRGLYLTFKDGYLLPVWLQEVLKEIGEQGPESFEAFTAKLIEHCPTTVGVSPTSPKGHDDGPWMFCLNLQAGPSWKDTCLLSHPASEECFDREQFEAMDLSALKKKHAHWSDPVWELPKEIRYFYFGSGALPEEVEERRVQVASRKGLATAWMLYWIESEFGQRDEGVSLHPTKEAAEEAYTKHRREGVYLGGEGYLGPIDGEAPKEVRINWDLYDRILASDRGYIHLDDPKEHDILTPL